MKSIFHPCSMTIEHKRSENKRLCFLKLLIDDVSIIYFGEVRSKMVISTLTGCFSWKHTSVKLSKDRMTNLKGKLRRNRFKWGASDCLY